jgi:hypothetical protein
MTRQPHDQFAKQYLAGLLEPLGTVEISREVSPEIRQVDVFFAPAPTANPHQLGLLGQMVERTCLLEAFRNQPTPTEIRTCILKLIAVQTEQQRQARREHQQVEEENLALLWVLTPSASTGLIAAARAEIALQKWPNGIYFLPDILKTAIVAINQLPTTPETLWVRILGKGATQKQAINELLALAVEHPFRMKTLEQISMWRINIESQQNVSEEDRELIMNLSPAYVEWRQATLQEGQRSGRLEERRLFVENLLRIRFGSLAPELAQIIEPMIELSTDELVPLLWQLSQTELLARFTPLEN